MAVWIYLLFFFSGFSALIYEVSWMRVLGLVLGNTNQAASCVLASFLGGLAIGAYFGGKLADQIREKHLLAYGVAEIGIAILAPVVTFLLGQCAEFIATNSQMFQGDAFSVAAARFILSGALLLLPTILMGSTLPFLVKFLVSRWSKPAIFFSQLYAINTFGAVAGSLVACFIGFAYLGITTTVLSAAAISGAVGIIACTVASRTSTAPEIPDSVNAVPTVADGDFAAVHESDDGRAPLTVLCSLAFLLGFTSLAYEVLWTRLIKFHIAPDTYAFTLMVSTFLLGLGLGSWIYERTLARRNSTAKEQLQYLSLIQYAAALACGTSLILMPLGSLLRSALEPALYPALGDLLGMLTTQFTVTSIYMLIPSTLIGLCFPMMGALAASRTGETGSAVGKVYGANTIGCVAGAIFTGLILLPQVGSYAGFQTVVCLTVLTGIVALFFSSAKPKLKTAFAFAPVLFCALFMMTRNPYETMLPNLVRFAEDSTSSVFVLKHPGYTQLVINGQPYASTILTGKRYMRMLGHLPLLVHKGPMEVLNICFGTGTTAGSIALHSDVKHLDIVDLSKAVLESADYFVESNYNVAKKPNVSLHVNDGRNFLLLSSKKYDVVTFEPPPPLEAGVVNLYSKQFYELVRKRLKPDGLMCQWIPMDQQSGLLWKLMVQSARAAFPYITVWETNDGQAVMLASGVPIQLDPAVVEEKLSADPDVKKTLDEVGLGTVPELMSTYLFSQRKFDSLLSEASEITDDRPKLEFFLPFGGPMIFPTELEKYAEPPTSVVKGNLDADALDRNLKAMHLLRQADESLRGKMNRPEANKYALQALEIAPENKFLQFAAKKYYDLR